MKGRKRSLAAKIAERLIVWSLGITVCVGFVSYHYTLKGIAEQYAENFHLRMLINYEYTRRVLSDVYVQVTNHVPYIESSLDWLTKKLAETDSTYNAQNNLAVQVIGLKSQSFIINYDGKFITHPTSEKLLEGQFFDHVRGSKTGVITILERKMKSGQQSDNETLERYMFNGEESYFFYTPLKYTDWMMVTVVPCRQIDVIGAVYVLKLMAFVLLGFLVLVAVAYIYIKTGIKIRYEIDKLECKRPEGV